MCYDIVFKAVFMGEDNILAKMVADITGIDYYILEDNIILEVTELPISKMDEKAKRCDFILRILDNMIINLELNSFKYNGLMIKNLSYLASIFASSTKKKKKYNEDFIVMQINLNCYEKNTDNALSHYQLQEVNTHKLYCKNISIFDLNVEKCNELYYNLNNKEDIPNCIKWGALLYCKDLNEIPNIVKGLISDEECDKIMSKLNKLTDDSYFMTEVEAMEWAEWERNSIEEELKNKYQKEALAEGLAEGRAKGIAEGREEAIISNIKKMIDKNIDISDISDITGKSIDEIKKIIENN